MNFDVIIATYNRPKSLQTLIGQILKCCQLPENIIVVDASTDENKEVQAFSSVKYIYSSHANQPYQRFVGYLASDTDFLIYFDDDMRLINPECFGEILNLYENEAVVGVQPNFAYSHEFLNNQVPQSKTRALAKKNKFFKFLKYLSGNPTVENGKFWFAGLRGNKPDNNMSLEWFNGPVFSARRGYLYNNFNFNLFTLYDDKLGKAEDAILGFTLSQMGQVIYLSTENFHHSDQEDSTYTVDFISYSKRVAYSRLYLSLEFARLSNRSIIIAFLHFNLFSLGRILSMVINQIIGFKHSRSRLLEGYIKGYFKAILDVKKIIVFDTGNNWKEEALKDIAVKSTLPVKMEEGS